MAIKDVFAKNGYARNVIFIIASSFALMMLMTYLFMSRSSFMHVAPVVVLLMMSGLCFFQSSKLYLPFCAGLLLQYGIFSGVMMWLTAGPSFSVFFYLITGIIGYLLLLTSIWQAILGEWKLPRKLNALIQTVSILGFLFFIFQIYFIATHLPPPSDQTEHHQTY
jgi:hypothetical protein